jgi:hypothetical protein
MRFLIGLASATFLISAAHGGTISAGPSTDRTFSFNFVSGANIFGPPVIDGYRSVDGKNFYRADSYSSFNEGQFNLGVVGTYAGEPASQPSKPVSLDLNSFFSSSRGGGSLVGVAGSPPGGGGSGGPLQTGGNSQGNGNSLFSEFGGINKFDGAADNFSPLGSPDRGSPNVSAAPLPPAWTMLLIGLACLALVGSRGKASEGRRKALRWAGPAQARNL